MKAARIVVLGVALSAGVIAALLADRSETPATTSSGFTAAILPSGMSAVSPQISPENGAGGFILPNDHDVLLTGRDREAKTLVLAQHLASLSLALGSITDARSTDPKADDQDDHRTGSVDVIRFGISTTAMPR
jgi:Flp pilus assembly protein CpaB